MVLTPAIAAAAPTVYEVRVDGLACPFCAYGIEKSLSAVEGVKKVEVDIASGLVTVTTADGASIGEPAIRQAVKDAGFAVRSIKTSNP
ncbi:MAG: heavy-metal-associated domain-containing protein [Candidatus Tectomicrobia bacterium]|uniref:Heavy-metal-associated domain-containing protein n=1 Tax=Tectimicrobiota bacterium TaxID=2528274 RepID=A0A932MM35_UNCTE|nr:heavy-metal-associated domain-containing protein [Candidatus Tectomicrobia bacterium]